MNGNYDEAVAFAAECWQRYLSEGVVIDFDIWPGEPSTEHFAKVGFHRPIDALEPDNNSAEAFDRLLNSTVLHIRAGNPVPEFLQQFAVDVLQGKRQRPKAYFNEHARDFTLWRMVEQLHDKYGLGRYSKGSPCKTQAADIVAEVTGETRDTVINAWNKHKAS